MIYSAPLDLISDDSEESYVIPISIFVALICLCIVVGHLLEDYRYANESIAAVLIGFLAGGAVLIYSKGTQSHILRFDEQLFFIYLLPPIIFNAGFQVKKKQFFHNFMTITLFGVAGVFISFSIIASGSWWLFPKIGFNKLGVREYLALGTIFSSTDTVCTLQVLNQDENPLLYSLVFGEGIVNDATSVVLYNAIQKMNVSNLNGLTALRVLKDFVYLFSASTVLGIMTGLLNSYALKAFYFGRHSTDREIALMVLMAYLSYMLAELYELSGILTVFFCGIVMSHYAWYNVTDKSRTTTRHTFSSLSFIAETFIFLYVGMDALDLEKWKVAHTSLRTSFGIYGVILLLVLVARAAFVFPLSAISNYMSSNHEDKSRITFGHQIIIWWAGLMRGAVSIALAFKQFTFDGVTWNAVDATMITSTIVVVLFSTVDQFPMEKKKTDDGTEAAEKKNRVVSLPLRIFKRKPSPTHHYTDSFSSSSLMDLRKKFKRSFENISNEVGSSTISTPTDNVPKNNSQNCVLPSLVTRSRLEVDLSDLPCDPSLRHQISDYDPNDQDIVRRAYLLKGPCPKSLDSNIETYLEKKKQIEYFVNYKVLNYLVVED